jgi:GH15 family glucan-1,4-alpha-glucosidase
MDDYPLIAEHGLIGDLQTAALLTTDGSINWFCAPRFDSPSIFGALLDHGRGGHFRVRPSSGAFDTKQMYLPDTAILITRFLSDAGVGEIYDFMPISGKVATDRHQIVRLLRCVRGEITFDVDLRTGHDQGLEQGAGRLCPALQRQGAGLLTPADVQRRIHHATGPHVAEHVACDGF